MRFKNIVFFVKNQNLILRNTDVPSSEDGTWPEAVPAGAVGRSRQVVLVPPSVDNVVNSYLFHFICIRNLQLMFHTRRLGIAELLELLRLVREEEIYIPARGGCFTRLFMY